MLPKKIDDLTKSDIEALVTNQVPEGRSLEFKQMLHGNKEKEKKEFLADVSSFANGAGGDILYGIKEHDGVAFAADGIVTKNADAEKLRLDESIRSGIEPRIAGVQIHAVLGFSNGPVIIIRIPKSWNSPHMVTFGGTSRFFSRTNAGKFQLDVTDIRSAFELSGALPERMRRFRDDRLAKVMANEASVQLAPNPQKVLHLFPLSAFTTKSYIDPAQIQKQSDKLEPLRGNSWDGRYNVDGFITTVGSSPNDAMAKGYCQAFRTGVIESVDAREVPGNDGSKMFHGRECENFVIRSVERYLSALREMEVSLPIVVMLSFLGYSGCKITTGYDDVYFNQTPIDRDVLLLPDILVEDYEADVPIILRPIFDAMWNAGGRECSPHYDESGQRK